VKLADAISRLKFTISKGNKPAQADIESFNKIAEYLREVQEKTVQENLLFAKLYSYLLEQLVLRYGDVKFAQKELGKILSDPMSMRIELLTMTMQQAEVTQVFADPMLKGKSGDELKEIFARYPKFESDFLACFDWWTKETVTSALETSINLSIQKFKNERI
jgi:hypothetical protein